MTLPTTPIYGLPHEDQDSQPLASLTGGSSGTEPILAEAVEAELERIDADIADIQSSIGVGWNHINSGNETGLFNIDLTRGGMFPPRTFEMIRVHFRGSLTSDGVRIQVRVNNDSTANLHRHGRIVFDPSQANNSNVADSNSTTGTAWPIAEWSTATANTAILTIFSTDGTSSLFGYQSTGVRVGAAGNHRLSAFGGDLAAGRELSNLQVFPVTGSIAACRWWAEGYRSVP